MWLDVECGTLRAKFQLRPPASDISTYALPQILSQDLAGNRHFLAPTPGMPPGIEITRSSETGAELDHTPLVNVQPSRRRTPRSIMGTGDCSFARVSIATPVASAVSDLPDRKSSF